MSTNWTRVGDLVAILRRRWDKGQYLREYATGETWLPVTLPVRAPTATELLNDFDEARAWVERFRRDSHTAGGRPRFKIENRTIKGKNLGSNDVPARIRLDSFGDLCALLGTTDHVRALDGIIDQTDCLLPALVPWVKRNPHVAIENRTIWPHLLATVQWISEHDTSRLYLRHIDVAGVDTKFVERNQRILSTLLTQVLPHDRLALDRSGFARRFGFRAKPDYTRFRLLGPVSTFPPGLSELRLRTDELAALDVPVTTVFVVENEVSYLAFPDVGDAMVIFGEGFQLTTLEALGWLHHKQIVYWGDIDTHGFAILNRLRSRFLSVTSILMDRETLLAHPDQYVSEPEPTAGPQPHLTEAEGAMYRDLIEDRYGPAVRLEQERVRFSLLHRALRQQPSSVSGEMQAWSQRDVEPR
jgi:hypothetical protein